jgi:hypothetical protein
MHRRSPIKRGAPVTSIADIIGDPHLLGPYFAGPSWARWRAVLKACRGIPPADKRERALFAEVAGGRRWPTAPVDELIAVAGRGGGKNSAASALAVDAALKVDPHRCRPGEYPAIFCFATDRRQAAITRNYITALFDEVPLLNAMVAERTAEGLLLKNRAEIVVCTANHRAPRGRTIAAAILDEACFWRGEESASPDIEVDTALTPGLARHEGSLKILISSAYTRDGLLYERFTANYGRDAPDILCVLGTTREFNPNFPQATVDRELAKDYPRFAAEFLSVWRDDLASFIARPVLEALLDKGVTEREYDPRYAYVAFSDDAGGSLSAKDASTFSIAHHDPETDRIVQDVLRVWQPPFNAAQVMAEKAAIARAFRLSTINGDNWGAGLTETIYRGHGITYEKCPPKSALYLDFLSLANSGKPLLLDDPVTVSQFCALERRIGFGSRTETIDHPQRDNFHDDVANVTAGAVVMAASEPGVMRISEEALALAAQPGPCTFPHFTSFRYDPYEEFDR